MKLFFTAVFMLILSGCAYMERVTGSEQYQQFCSWAPVAIVGIEQAAQEALKDPAKLHVAQPMLDAVGYLQLAASACAKPTP